MAIIEDDIAVLATTMFGDENHEKAKPCSYTGTGFGKMALFKICLAIPLREMYSRFQERLFLRDYSGTIAILSRLIRL